MKRISILALTFFLTMGCMQAAIPTVAPSIIETMDTKALSILTPPPFRIHSAPPAKTERGNIVTPYPQGSCLVVTAEHLRLRVGPGTSYAEKDILERGEKLTGNFVQGSWWYVGNGWVHSAWVEECE